ncbi:MAG: M28 family peptidase, partial [Polaribacter sp.]
MKIIVSFLIVLLFFSRCAVHTKGDDDARVKVHIDTVSGSKNNTNNSVIDSNMVRKHLYTLSADNMEGRQSGTPGIEKAAVYIEDEFKKIGLSTFGDLDSYRQTFTFKNRKSKDDIISSNIIGVLEGKSKKDEYVIISAHYDHLGMKKSGAGDLIYNG